MMASSPVRRATRGTVHSAPSPAATTPKQSDNKLREALDDGVLTIKKNYQDFGVFLDIKKELRSEFLTSLWNHVAHEQSTHEQLTWEMLASDPRVRRACATSFITKVGMKYWGTKENRQKCLMPDSLKDRDLLFTYPERKRELIDVVMILLEKKAAAEAGGSQDPKRFRGRLQKAESPDYRISPFSISESPCPPSQKRKRRSTAGHRRGTRFSPESVISDTDVDMQDDPKLSVQIDVPSQASPHTPSKSPKKNDMSTASPNGKRIKLSEKKKDGAKTIDYSSALLRRSISEDVGFTQLRERFGPRSRYLVDTTNQEGMAPVFVPFRRFDSVSSFLEALEAETHLREWSQTGRDDPSAQLDVELRRQTMSDGNFFHTNVTAPQTYRVFAASVKFEWSGFSIRVRPGHDEDLREVMDELQRSWSREIDESTANSNSGDVEVVNQHRTFFNIHVMLHVISL